MERGVGQLCRGTFYQHHRLQRESHFPENHLRFLKRSTTINVRRQGAEGWKNGGWRKGKLHPLNGPGTETLLLTFSPVSLGSVRRRSTHALVSSQGSTQRHVEMWSGDMIPRVLQASQKHWNVSKSKRFDQVFVLMTVSKPLCAYEDGRFKKKHWGQWRSTKNLHSIIWPGGTAKVGCKKTINDYLSIWKGALNSNCHKLVRLFLLD